MRILYIDIDTLRADHLGCYGYHRNTTPAIDSVAKQGVRFENVYCSDAPCLPSRTALFSGRYGVHSGVVDHAGVAADFFHEGEDRKFRSTLGDTSWMSCMQNQGYHTASISPFAQRHSAWWFNAGFNEMINPGKLGNEIADDVQPLALDWIKRNSQRDNWFLHVNLWDPHIPYRTPADYGNPFKDDPIPDWLTEDIRQKHWQGFGPESAQDAANFHGLARTGKVPDWYKKFERQPVQMDSMEQVRRMFDGYDTGVRYADDTVQALLQLLKDQGIEEETAIVISSDHGENLGELNIYSAHMTADRATCHIPLIIRWPGVTDKLAGQTLQAFHNHLDLAPTVVELVGGRAPKNWDAIGYGQALQNGTDSGRDYLVISHMAGCCQRSVRFDDYLCIRSYHDGYHGFPEYMLFDIVSDPHMQRNLVTEKPELVNQATLLLDQWLAKAMRTATVGQDPLWTVMHAGGPEHVRGDLDNYLIRLRATGRSAAADELESKHGAA